MAKELSAPSLLASCNVSYRSKTSRYRNSLQYDGWAIEDDFVLYPDHSDTQFFVDTSTAQRPDLIAYEVYGNPLLAWVIMRRNGIHSLNQLVFGTVLWIPSRARINDRGGILAL